MAKKARLARAVVAALVLTLSACGGSDSATPAPTATPTPPPTPVARTLSFDTNGSSGTAPAQIIYTADQAIQIPKVDLTVAGYTFAGWNVQSDGSGTNYAPEATVTLPAAVTVLYAQFKPPPIKITQQGGDGESRLLVEWPDGSQQDIVYTPDIVGWGNRYDFNPIVGGIAIGLSGRPGWIHTCYPIDYLPDHQPVMTVTAGGTKLLNATSFRLSDREGSPLAAAGASVTADEIKVTVKGRIVDAEADTEVELILRSDAPRMALTHAKITYTRPTSVSRLYHQLVHASPLRLSEPITYLSVTGGEIIDVPALPTSLTGGLFFKTEPGFYVGFLAPRAGAEDFYSRSENPYFAAYKIIYDNASMQPGEFTESRGVATWGFAIADARRLLSWSGSFTRGIPPVVANIPYVERGALRMISQAYAAN